MKTMEEFLLGFNELRSEFEKRPLLYGGTLFGVETFWHAIRAIDSLLYDRNSREGSYHTIAMKYHCGNWSIASKTEEEAKKKKWDSSFACQTLMSRLKEVEVLEQPLEEKQ